ncbi:Amino-acid acetyltransferase, mitochondrial [Vermiconidia calcicola]|uniref:Amino-acid acetyltransferase, mitochondrial n=1 Tax=Vermiconidia calcicola TaxID=1690605 RepID=A0ACC3MW20_9PEZI|nr:Amino-acid acetyltransferase, mitochondrial [Vermiconidia calcicola]
MKRLGYSTAPAPAPPPSTTNNGAKPTADPATQRELFMNVLNANATKRDAKQYLARFDPPKKQGATLSPLQAERNARHRQDQDRLDRIGVNLGALYAPARAIAETPQFNREMVDEKASAATPKIHVALVCLRAPETLDEGTLEGVALTLSQLVKLDMRILVVLDCGSPAAGMTDVKEFVAEHGERIVKAIGKYSPEGARVVSGAIETAEQDDTDHEQDGKKLQSASVSIPDLLMGPLKRSIIPLVPTLAYTPTGKQVHTSGSDIMTALSSLLSGLPTNRCQGTESVKTPLDRIIVLDAIGGIPSKARGDGAHVFVNLEQEFDDIQSELEQYGCEQADDEHQTTTDVYAQHRSNLSMVQKCLSMLPSASSALIITPQEAASSSLQQSSDESTIGTGTRRQKNILIHNLLTNKPGVSSSLPVARMPSTNSDTKATAMPQATLLKRGMPLTIIPAIDRSSGHGLGWQPPSNGTTTLDLETDSRIDLPRLVHLIEDSFRRKLDVRHYLNRIKNRTAGLIIAGSYEGAAILTWETPPGGTRLVPYLDKFAVLSSSQGSSGVADIVFQSMVRTCFPQVLPNLDVRR